MPEQRTETLQGLQIGTGRKSRVSTLNSKVLKGEGGGTGPVVVDPEDGSTRTPKPLLHSGPLQVPAKQLNSLLALDDSGGLQAVSEGERTLQVFPSFGSISNVGSISNTPAASEQGEEPLSPQALAEKTATSAVRLREA
jgi:hypothetical protein